MKVFVGSLIVAAAGISAAGQEPKLLTPPTPPVAAARVLAELGSLDRAVKNSPFSADAVSESVQTLADGNRIVHTSTTKLYRNSEGRTRRETANGSGGLLGTTFSYSPGVTILDPAGGSRYLLDDRLKTAEQTLLRVAPQIRVVPQISAEAAPTADQKVAIEKATTELRMAAPVIADQKIAIERLQGEVRAMTPAVIATADAARTIASGLGSFTVFTPEPRSKYETKTEELGAQNIEGVDCEGTRTTTIIPAGAIGNDRPIETVYEKWYSRELQLVIMSKHTDPRFGEQTYRLTNIQRSEPDPSLFSLPTGYKVISDTGTVYRAKADAEKAATVKASQAPTAVKNKP